MTDNYTKLVLNNLNRLYSKAHEDLARNLPGEKKQNRFIFKAFGKRCVITPDGITLNGKEANAIIGILISLYALHVGPDVMIPTPLKAFKEFPDSAPYAGAFATHTEQLLVPHVEKIKTCVLQITEALNGKAGLKELGGDFSFIVYPLPKIGLGYIFYEADDDFPASVTCLFSNNANLFMPMDGLADVGEYTSRRILSIIDA